MKCAFRMSEILPAVGDRDHPRGCARTALERRGFTPVRAGDPRLQAAKLFQRNYLSVSQHGARPLSSDPLFGLVGTFDPALLPDGNGFPSSDHRLVAVDVGYDR